jgi:hypothetical protein
MDRAPTVAAFFTGDPVWIDGPALSPANLLGELGLPHFDKPGLLTLAPRIALVHALVAEPTALALRGCACRAHSSSAPRRPSTSPSCSPGPSLTQVPRPSPGPDGALTPHSGDLERGHQHNCSIFRSEHLASPLHRSGSIEVAEARGAPSGRGAMRSVMAWTVLVAGLTFGLVGPASSADSLRYSGTVVELDTAEGRLIIDEIGPWRVVRGEVVRTRRTIALKPSTRFNVFIRVDVQGRFAGDFIEVQLEASDVAPGDFVTVECARQRDRLVALTVTLADLMQP